MGRRPQTWEDVKEALGLLSTHRCFESMKSMIQRSGLKYREQPPDIQRNPSKFSILKAERNLTKHYPFRERVFVGLSTF